MFIINAYSSMYTTEQKYIFIKVSVLQAIRYSVLIRQKTLVHF